MATVRTCATCGEKITLGECLYCPPPEAPTSAPPPPQPEPPAVLPPPPPAAAPVRTCASCGEKLPPHAECLFCSPFDLAAPSPALHAAPVPVSPERRCASCGEPVPAGSSCLFCAPVGITAPAAPPLPIPALAHAPAPLAPAAMEPIPTLASVPGSEPADAADRAHGLLLFEAEEALARGAPEKAIVVASRAVKERPGHLTARALLERARRELLKGKKRDKLDARLVQARGLADAGDFDGAERIVVLALKLIPDHPVGLQLFALLKERRLKQATPESQAERELERMARAQAVRALEQARRHQATGHEARAVATVRHALRSAPDDPDLLSLLRQLQGTIVALEQDAARRRALLSQVRAGLELKAQGQFDAALQVLRGVLDEDPENARARRAVLDVETALLQRNAAAPAIAAPAAAAPPPQRPAPREDPRPPVALPPRPAPRATEPPRPAAALPAAAPLSARPSGAASRPLARPSGPALPGSPARRTIPPEVMLPRRRATTPWGLILGCGAALVAGVLYVATRDSNEPLRPAAQRPLTPPPPSAPVVSGRAAGPLQELAPELRQTLERTLEAYASALEARDPAALARARPDLTEPFRTQLLAPFVGALNATTDLRVLEVEVKGPVAVVTLLRTDVIVGGNAQSRPPVEEQLRLVQERGGWTLTPP